MYGNFMSGDSPDFKPHKKKEEETDLLMPDKTRPPITTIAAAGTAVASSEVPTDSTEKPEEKQEFIKRDKEETKEAAGDANDRDKDFKNDKQGDYLENDKVTNKSDKQDSEKYEDKVDSVYLRPPPPHKTRSNVSNTEEEDCGIKCLYYTLQCCDCVLM
ncbi:uncharacterized protein LOC142986283 isoform X2 [Anticarsia gemmatalis]|uniref:uncharacterized protein LOC142986283 isoform X2 n=1 Tax=Anticarsia gemmatalis TaxID=129554 RepID=UPI003F768CA7